MIFWAAVGQGVMILPVLIPVHKNWVSSLDV